MIYLASVNACMHCLLVLLFVVPAAFGSEDFSPPNNLHDLQAALDSLQLPVVSNVSAAIGALSGARSSPDRAGCASACNLLGNMLRDDVFRPASWEFIQQQSSYWSNQQVETQPACRVLPKSAKEVAVAYLVATTSLCNFAVKGGGHAAFAGASSIQAGITIDLQNLDSLSVSADKTLTQVGAGNKWIDVYEHLTPKELAVVGGRVSDIGVSGLTLGGGISYFSGRRGWACDGVVNYEVVLANGKIYNASVSTNPDLYWALRGGGNNFGIVTRLDLETFPQGDMLGGVNTYSLTANTSLFSAYQDFVIDQAQDQDAALILGFAYIQGTWLAVNNYEYPKPITSPAIFRNFFAVPKISSTERITNLTDLTAELTTYNPHGYR
ncbi:MAG: hypothetical protein Q9218_007511 [Villophora microphyllina]